MMLYRPIARMGAPRPPGALPLAGGWCWFTEAEAIPPAGPRQRLPAADLPPAVLARLTAPRAPVLGLAPDRPLLMGILNTTPDSFSDGGRFDRPDAALAQARAMLAGGADILDIGGESTRPGAADVPVDEEIRRTAPMIAALAGAGQGARLSVDTRKAAVAQAALAAGAGMVNDVAALGFDPALAGVVAAAGAGLCLMHAKGTPRTMQADPRYEDVTREVYGFLEDRIAVAEAAGIPRARICVDPGIGFGKTVAHNLTLLRDIAVFHGLGCPILLGVSRKRFIGTLSGEDQAERRGPGTIALTLAAVAQGVQLHRVHDISQTRQALSLWQAVCAEDRP